MLSEKLGNLNCLRLINSKSSLKIEESGKIILSYSDLLFNVREKLNKVPTVRESVGPDKSNNSLCLVKRI